MRLIIIVFIIMSMANLGCETVMPVFNEEKAFNHLLAQCEFGPRNPGSDGHMKTKKYILNFVQERADTVIVQEFSFKSALENKNHKGTNIIARVNPTSNTQILIGAHWDTRPLADQDEDSRNYENAYIRC